MSSESPEFIISVWYRSISFGIGGEPCETQHSRFRPLCSAHIQIHTAIHKKHAAAQTAKGSALYSDIVAFHSHGVVAERRPTCFGPGQRPICRHDSDMHI